MKQQPLYKAFIHAFNGLLFFFRNDRNGRIHLLAAMIVVMMAAFLHLAAMEWAVILVCIAWVMALEMLNHALEKLCDAVHPETHPFIKAAKDVAAGAVLVSAIISMIIGLIIFLPKIVAWL